ncbi:MAG: VOC family protein [Dehalococcoidales bacterium]|nr:VOC family protein [Dehalococcoidales bacterium]
MAGKAATKFPALGHIGVAVKDLDKTIKFYSSTFGIKPWRMAEADYKDVMVRGKKQSFKVRLAFASLGPVEIELIEIRGGKALYSEYLDAGREGLHHLGFHVSKEDKDRITASLAEQGIEVSQGANSRLHSGSYAYFDTEKIGGVIFELVNRPPGWDPHQMSKPYEPKD